ncbi:ATP/GTP-binding protein [Streptomyces sp. NPDC092046]|uniref:ATP/GTP-binding protein n=1 Tax=Streptomyces sp. NPDC092046 TaxID=3366009 RepID=UPI0038261CAB
MSDVDDPNGILVRGPWRDDSSYAPPPVPDFADTIPPPEDTPEAPPESPEVTTLELPPIPSAPDPATALYSEGITEPEADDDGEEYEEGEYAQPRSLADRLGDWLEFRLEKARVLHESESPFREAEIARKVALLEGRTAREVAMMEQNGKLHAAVMKAKGDKAAARGKSDADRTKSTGSGMGADKGRSKSGGAGGGPSRTNPGPPRGSNSSGSSGRSGIGPGGSGTGGKGAGKGSDGSSGGRTPGSGRGGSSGGSKGSQGGSGGSGRSGRGEGGGRGHDPASNARTERARGRQERAGARQAGRQERRAADQSANAADRSKDRDQTRAQRQQAWQDRRAKRQEREAARKAKREAAAYEQDRTTLGQAVAEEAQRRWDKRRADEKNPEAGTAKVSPVKDQGKDGAGNAGRTSKDPDGESSATKDNQAADGPDKEAKAGDGPSQGAKAKRRARRTATGRTRRRGRTRRTSRTGGGRTGRFGRRKRAAGSPFGEEDSPPTVEWPDHPTRPPRAHGTDEGDIEDAVIVPDGPAAVTTGVKGLPPAPEPHTARPGTSRPHTSEGSSVNSEVSRPSGQGGLEAQHRTDITFDEYLMEMATIGVQAGADQEGAEDLMKVLGRVADALREMAADLIGDHNVDTDVTDLISDLADAAGRMKAQAERCAKECGIAWEAARLAASMVARVYGEDMAAKEDAGLTYASAAAHHD